MTANPGTLRDMINAFVPRRRCLEPGQVNPEVDPEELIPPATYCATWNHPKRKLLLGCQHKKQLRRMAVQFSSGLLWALEWVSNRQRRHLWKLARRAKGKIPPS